MLRRLVRKLKVKSVKSVFCTGRKTRGKEPEIFTYIVDVFVALVRKILGQVGSNYEGKNAIFRFGDAKSAESAELASPNRNILGFVIY